MYEIRVHGLGGQGAVTLVRWAARAAYDTGKHVQAFPFFGAERRGAPVKAFVRVDEQAIDLRSQVYDADLVVVMSRDLLVPAMEEGIARDGQLLVNGIRELAARCAADFSRGVYHIDATGIALDLGLEIEGMPMVNIPLLGAVVEQSRIAGADEVLDIVRDIGSRKGSEDVYVEAATRGSEEIGFVEWKEEN